MKTDSLHRPVINPIQYNQPRPVWSVMIPAFNCTKYIAETIRSVLVQDEGRDKMQIEVVDDFSSDGDLEKLVNEIGCGRVSYYRQHGNVGHLKNFETCINRSYGKIIHLLHGDDYVKPGFYKKLQYAFDHDNEIGAAFTRQIFIDETGNQLEFSPIEQDFAGRLKNQLELLASEQRIMTPSIVVRRDVYEKLGGFDSRLICSEDWEMWVRIASVFPIWYDPEPLAVYRMHLKSNTGRHIRTAEDIKYTRDAINIFKEYLPPKMAKQISKAALKTYAKSAIDMAFKLYMKKDFTAVNAQIKEAFACSRHLSIYNYLLYNTFKAVKRTFFHNLKEHSIEPTANPGDRFS